MALFSARHPGLALATASFTCSVHRLLHVPLVWPTYFFPVVPTATYINPCPCFGMCRSRSPRVSSAPLLCSNPASHQSQGLAFDAHHFAVAARRSCRWRDQRATQTRPCALPLAPCAHSRTPLAVFYQVKQQVESQIKVRDVSFGHLNPSSLYAAPPTLPTLPLDFFILQLSHTSVSIAPADYSSWHDVRTELMSEAKGGFKARVEAELAAGTLPPCHHPASPFHHPSTTLPPPFHHPATTLPIFSRRREPGRAQGGLPAGGARHRAQH